jgi:hypothetical protein
MNWSIRLQKKELLLLAVLGILSLALPLRIFTLVFTNCCNAPAVDEVSVLPILSTIFENKEHLSWLSVLRECDVGSVNLLPTILFDFMLASCVSYDVRVQLASGILLHFGAALTLGSSLPARYGKFVKFVYSAFYIILAATTSLSTIYFNGQTCVTSGLASFFLAISIASACKSRDSWLWTALLSLSILFLSFFGRFYFYSTVLCLVSGFVLSANSLNFRNLVIATIPGTLVCFLLMKPTGYTTSFGFAADRTIGTLGLALSNGFADTVSPFPESLMLGTIAIVAGLFVLFAITFLKLERAGMMAPICLGTFGLISIFSVTVFRTSIFAWYAGCSMNVWLALIGIATIGFVETTNCLTSRNERLHLEVARSGFALIVVSILIFALRSDLSYADKDYFRRTHAPATESAMRNYEYAPTIAEQYVSPGTYCGLTHPASPLLSKLAPILKKFHWSACSANQTWLLQGDFLFPTVSITNGPTSSGIAWIDGLKVNRKKSWDAPEHLNLRLGKDDLITWKVLVPSKARQVNFVTDLFSTNPGPESKTTIQIHQSSNVTGWSETIKAQKRWQNVDVDLSQYAGTEIQIMLKYNCANSPKVDFLVSKQPRIILKGVESEPKSVSKIPCNLSTSPMFPHLKASDLQLPDSNTPAWDSFGLKPLASKKCEYRIIAPFAKQTFNQNLSIPVKDYNFLCLDLQQTGVGMHFCCIQLTVNGSRIENIFLPISTKFHRVEHAVDLKHYSFEPGDLITGVTIFPTYHQPEGTIFFKSLRFARK